MSKKHTFILSHPNTEWWQFRNGDQQVSTCENDAAMLTSEERFQNTPLLHKLVRPAFTAMLRFVICTMCWHSFRKDNKYKNATNQGVNYRKGLQGYFCGREGELIWATEPLIRMAWMNSSIRLMMWGWQRVVDSLLWPQIVFVCACMCACILSFFCLLVCVPATTLCPIGTTSSSITTKHGYEATACLNILLFHFSIFPSLSLFSHSHFCPVLSLSLSFPHSLFFLPPVLSASAVCFRVLPVSLRWPDFTGHGGCLMRESRWGFQCPPHPRWASLTADRQQGSLITLRQEPTAKRSAAEPTTSAASHVLSEFKMHGGWVYG